MRKFNKRFEDFRAGEKLIEQKVEERQAELERLKASLAALEQGINIPTEEDLSLSRAVRSEGWQLVRRAWLDKQVPGEDLEQFIKNLAERFQFKTWPVRALGPRRT